MSSAREQLQQTLAKITRPGTFCTSGAVPFVLPGLVVDGIGPIGLPLAALQADELKKCCEQAPYGKGEQTLVDTSVRRVWRLTPERFSLTNPEWDDFLREIVGRVQRELGLEKQKLESHLYDLLMYEPGSFFLPHKDGEKLDRMVATLVVVLPSSFQGGELIVRHEGQEVVIDSGGPDSAFRVHFAAFYADCEHEIRPLREGHRLCLVYNLTLARSKKGLSAPRTGEHVEAVGRILRKWVEEDAAPHKLAITLEHQYTKDGLTWDALKGVDRVKARVLADAASQAGCHAYLALLTFHESGSAEYADGGYGYRRRYSRWDDEDEDEADGGDSKYEMTEVIESELSAEQWTGSDGARVPFGQIFVKEDELLDPEALRDITPEEHFEGYTGNAGMTLDRWYRHAAIFLWPNKKHFEVLCDAGLHTAVPALGEMVKKWRQARGKDAEARKGECLAFANAILSRWKPSNYPRYRDEPAEPHPLLKSLEQLGDERLVRRYLTQVLALDRSVDPGKTLAAVCKQHGWATFQPELVPVFAGTDPGTLRRNAELLEVICLARAKSDDWLGLCRALAEAYVQALEAIDEGKVKADYYVRDVGRSPILAALGRSLLATDQHDLLSRVVTRTLADTKKYPLEQHVTALLALRPWIEKNVSETSPPLSTWVAACREQLEALTAAEPQPPADHRREATIKCKCADCAKVNKFLRDPAESEFRLATRQEMRSHVENYIRNDQADLDCRTEERSRPYTLVCTKNTASYKRALKKYHQDQEHLAGMRAIEVVLTPAVPSPRRRGRPSGR